MNDPATNKSDKRVDPHAETRVMQKKPEAPTLYPVGTIVMKKFGKGRLRAIHCGKVKRYDEDRKYYWIDYDNGDLEEMTHKQVK